MNDRSRGGLRPRRSDSIPERNKTVTSPSHRSICEKRGVVHHGENWNGRAPDSPPRVCKTQPQKGSHVGVRSPTSSQFASQKERPTRFSRISGEGRFPHREFSPENDCLAVAKRERAILEHEEFGPFELRAEKLLAAETKTRQVMGLPWVKNILLAKSHLHYGRFFLCL